MSGLRPKSSWVTAIYSQPFWFGAHVPRRAIFKQGCGLQGLLGDTIKPVRIEREIGSLLQMA